MTGSSACPTGTRLRIQALALSARIDNSAWANASHEERQKMLAEARAENKANARYQDALRLWQLHYRSCSACREWLFGRGEPKWQSG